MIQRAFQTELQKIAQSEPTLFGRVSRAAGPHILPAAAGLTFGPVGAAGVYGGRAAANWALGLPGRAVMGAPGWLAEQIGSGVSGRIRSAKNPFIGGLTLAGELGIGAFTAPITLKNVPKDASIAGKEHLQSLVSGIRPQTGGLTVMASAGSKKQGRVQDMKKIAYSTSALRRAKKIREGLEKSAAKRPSFRRMRTSLGNIFEEPPKRGDFKSRKPRTAGEWFMAGAALAGGGALFGVGASALEAAVGTGAQKFREAGQNRRFQKMVMVDPSLKRERGAAHMFQVLDRASPYLAGEPILAAATVRQMLETPPIVQGGIPAIDPRTMKGIFEVEKIRRDVTPFQTTKKRVEKLPDFPFSE